MGLITLDKIWKKTRRVSVGNTNYHVASSIVELKNALVESGCWFVQQSSNSIDHGTDDHWADQNSIVNNNSGGPHSWIVLRNSHILDGENFEICIEFNGSNRNILSVYCSHTGYNLDGTVTTKPTAITFNHEQTISNQETYFAGVSSSVVVVTVMTSTDGQCTRCIFSPKSFSSGSSGIWLFDRLKNPPSWLIAPYLAMAVPFTGEYYVLSSLCFPQYLNYCNKTVGVARAWHDDTQIKVTFGAVGVTSPLFTTVGGRIPRADNGSYPLMPIYPISLTPQVPGFLGQLYDLYWLPDNFGDKSHAVLGYISDICTVPLIYLPTADSEAGLFNFGVWAFGNDGKKGMF